MLSAHVLGYLCWSSRSGIFFQAAQIHSVAKITLPIRFSILLLLYVNLNLFNITKVTLRIHIATFKLILID